MNNSILTLTGESTNHQHSAVTGTDSGNKRLLDVCTYASTYTKNTFSAVKTSVTTSATAIQFPEKAENVVIMHVSTGNIVWLGEDASVSVAGGTAFPLIANTPYYFTFKQGNNNNLYAIAGSTIPVYVAGVTNE